MKEITITKREEGQRFDRFLGKYLPGASSGFLHKMLRKKNIKLNGKKAEGREKLSAGDLIQIFFTEDAGKTARKNKTKEKTDKRRDESSRTGKSSLFFRRYSCISQTGRNAFTKSQSR